MRVITNDKRFMSLLSISCVFKNLYVPILLHSFSPVQSLGQLFSPSLSFHKSYLQSKTFLNMRAVRSGAVFCSNAVLIRTLSSSMHFFSFFNVLPSAPTTTRMTLMLLMFHILLISLLSA